MFVLLDTNLLVRMSKPDDPLRDSVFAATSRLHRDGHEAVLVPQCLYEFYVVATRPLDVNGLGFAPHHAVSEIEEYIRLHRLLRDERAVFEEWRALVEHYDVRGKPAHDARLVAAMRRHSIPALLTLNAADFVRYAPEITVLDPRRMND